jgi:hypothetical protein
VIGLAGGALVAGCGSSSTSTQTVSASTNPAAPKLPTGRQAVELCQHGIRVQPSISASAKTKLEKTCQKTASGSQAALQEVVKAVCVELVNASHLPSGAAKERALTVCKAP